MQLQVFKAFWGMTEPVDEQFRKIADAGFDGVEGLLPPLDIDEAFRALLKRYQFDYVPQLITSGADWREHLDSFVAHLPRALSYNPQLINVHCGCDWYAIDDQMRYLEAALAAYQPLTDARGVTICHETHRGRMFCLPRDTGVLLRTFPEINITADFAHWTVASESMLDDPAADIALTCERSRHIHGRIGYEEGPQVPDSRAPEYQYHVDKHVAWWRTIVAANRSLGRKRMVFAAEVGPPNYMHTLPYTGQPVSDNWDQNLHMADVFRTRIMNGAS